MYRAMRRILSILIYERSPVVIRRHKVLKVIALVTLRIVGESYKLLTAYSPPLTKDFEKNSDSRRSRRRGCGVVYSRFNQENLFHAKMAQQSIHQ